MAAEVEFHTGVADPVGFACRLLRKAYRKGARVAVTAPAEVLGLLDRELWTFDERDFVPHVRVGPRADAALVARTPIWLVDGTWPADPPPVLVNLGAPVPGDPAAFSRIIEVVSAEPDDVEGGRRRWREYLAAGLKPDHRSTGG